MTFCVAVVRDDDIEKQLRLSVESSIDTYLPLGPHYDDYKMSIWVKIFDRKQAFTLEYIDTVRVSASWRGSASSVASELVIMAFSTSSMPPELLIISFSAVLRGPSYITYAQISGFQTHPPTLYAQIMTSQ